MGREGKGSSHDLTGTYTNEKASVMREVAGRLGFLFSAEIVTPGSVDVCVEIHTLEEAEKFDEMRDFLQSSNP